MPGATQPFQVSPSKCSTPDPGSPAQGRASHVPQQLPRTGRMGLCPQGHTVGWSEGQGWWFYCLSPAGFLNEAGAKAGPV